MQDIDSQKLLCQPPLDEVGDAFIEQLGGYVGVDVAAFEVVLCLSTPCICRRRRWAWKDWVQDIDSQKLLSRPPLDEVGDAFLDHSVDVSVLMSQPSMSFFACPRLVFAGESGGRGRMVCKTSVNRHRRRCSPPYHCCR